MLVGHCSRLKESAHIEEAALSGILIASSRSVERVSAEVSCSLLSMSNVAAPHKILVFLKNRLLKLSSLSSANREGRGLYTEAPHASKQAWLKTQFNHSAFAEICLKLLPPCLMA